jgi:uncharacterized membrane protein HdeD (DUF308 family)
MKNPFSWTLLIFSTLASTYLVFLGVVSISVGLQHTEEDGSWMPLLTGSLFIFVVLWALFRVARSLVQTSRKTESLDLN